jgi:hypothetical protein
MLLLFLIVAQHESGTRKRYLGRSVCHFYPPTNTKYIRVIEILLALILVDGRRTITSKAQTFVVLQLVIFHQYKNFGEKLCVVPYASYAPDCREHLIFLCFLWHWHHG